MGAEMTAQTCPHCGAVQSDLQYDEGLDWGDDRIEESSTCLRNQIAAQAAEIEILRSALTDMLAGWHYIRLTHGDLSGVNWDIYQNNAIAALKTKEVK